MLYKGETTEIKQLVSVTETFQELRNNFREL